MKIQAILVTLALSVGLSNVCVAESRDELSTFLNWMNCEKFTLKIMSDLSNKTVCSKFAELTGISGADCGNFSSSFEHETCKECVNGNLTCKPRALGEVARWAIITYAPEGNDTIKDHMEFISEPDTISSIYKVTCSKESLNETLYKLGIPKMVHVMSYFRLECVSYPYKIENSTNSEIDISIPFNFKKTNVSTTTAMPTISISDLLYPILQPRSKLQSPPKPISKLIPLPKPQSLPKPLLNKPLLFPMLLPQVKKQAELPNLPLTTPKPPIHVKYQQRPSYQPVPFFRPVSFFQPDLINGAQTIGPLALFGYIGYYGRYLFFFL